MTIPKVLDELKPLFEGHSGDKKINVLFVCLGNICRSPAAEGVLGKLLEEKPDAARWDVDSCGTGGYHVGSLPDPRMRAHAARRGLDLRHRCRQVSVCDFFDFDLIIPMDESNTRNLRRIAPSVEAGRKVIPMSSFFSLATKYDHVPDPYYEGAEGFELVLDLLEDAAVNLYDCVEAVLPR